MPGWERPNLDGAVGPEALEELPVVRVGHGDQHGAVEHVQQEEANQVGGQLLNKGGKAINCMPLTFWPLPHLEDELVDAALPLEEDLRKAAEAAGVGHVGSVRHSHGERGEESFTLPPRKMAIGGGGFLSNSLARVCRSRFFHLLFASLPVVADSPPHLNLCLSLSLSLVSGLTLCPSLVD